MADDKFPVPTIAQVQDEGKITKQNGLSEDGKSAVFVDLYEKDSTYLKDGGNIVVHWCYGSNAGEDVALMPPQYVDTKDTVAKFHVSLELLQKAAGKTVYVYYKYQAPGTGTMEIHHKDDAKKFLVDVSLSKPVVLSAPVFIDSTDQKTLASIKTPLKIRVPANEVLTSGTTVAVTLTGYDKNGQPLRPSTFSASRTVNTAGTAIDFDIAVAAWTSEDVGSIRALYAINTNEYMSPTATVKVGGESVLTGVYSIKVAGAGDHTQRGDGHGGDQPPWDAVGSERKWKVVTKGGCTHLAIDEHDQLWGWGLNDTGQSGTGNSENEVKTPSKCVFSGGHAGKIIDASTAFYHALALDDSGQLWATGRTNDYRTGASLGGDIRTFSKVGMVRFKKISAGAIWQEGMTSTCGLGISQDGYLYEWGTSDKGVLTQTNGAITTPTKVASVENLKWKFVTHYSECAAAITEDGDLYMWGYNFSDRDNLAGAGNSLGRSTIVSVSNGAVTVDSPNSGEPVKWKKIEFGYFHVLAIDTKNRLWGWGQDRFRCLTKANDQNNIAPFRLMDGYEVIDIAANYGSSSALTKEGHVYSWGLNDNYGVGLPNTGSFPTPTRLASLYDKAGAITSGYRSIFVLCTDQAF